MERHEFANGKSLKSAEYDPATSQVTVEFASGDKKAHAAVTPEEWAEWRAADVSGGNPGQWYHSKIRQRPRQHPEVPLAGAVAPAPSSPAESAPPTAPVAPQAPAPGEPAATAATAAPAEPHYKTALARARASHQRKS